MKKSVDYQFKDPFYKWEVLKTSSAESVIVIKSVKEAGGVTATLYPYKVPKRKAARLIKLLWLKLRVWLKIIR